MLRIVRVAIINNYWRSCLSWIGCLNFRQWVIHTHNISQQINYLVLKPYITTMDEGALCQPLVLHGHREPNLVLKNRRRHNAGLFYDSCSCHWMVSQWILTSLEMVVSDCLCWPHCFAACISAIAISTQQPFIADLSMASIIRCCFPTFIVSTKCGGCN